MKLAEINQKLKNIKCENLNDGLDEAFVKADPFEQFLICFNHALEFATDDPSAMVLATVDEHGFPNMRIVLLKEFEDQKFIFYTNYESQKARNITHHPVVALNFYWPNLHCQIRIRGRIEKITKRKNELYFASRPRESQLGAHAWVQSSVVKSRREMIDRIKIQEEKFSKEPIYCPENWGGYAVLPFEYEFFQRRQWRMHDRLLYTWSETNQTWTRVRLAP